VYSGDTVPCPSLASLAHSCDVLLCEADLAHDEPTSDKVHHTPEDAGDTATSSQASRLIITHIGRAMTPDQAMARAATASMAPSTTPPPTPPSRYTPPTHVPPVTERPAPLIRATAESADSIDDPSEDALFKLLEDLEAGHGSYLVVDALLDATNQTYIQTSRSSDGSHLIGDRDGQSKIRNTQKHSETPRPLLRVSAVQGPSDRVARGGVEPPTFRFSAMRRRGAGWRRVSSGAAIVRPSTPGVR
jgi:hypothetical protein